MSHSGKPRRRGFLNRTWKQSLVALPGVGVSLLPKLACPLCWPAYVGLLSSVGLGFLISARYLLPFTAAILALALVALAFKAKERHGYKPLVLGVVGVVGILAGKFEWESKVLYTAQRDCWSSVRCGTHGRKERMPAVGFIPTPRNTTEPTVELARR